MFDLQAVQPGLERSAIPDAFERRHLVISRAATRSQRESGVGPHRARHHGGCLDPCRCWPESEAKVARGDSVSRARQVRQPDVASLFAKIEDNPVACDDDCRCAEVQVLPG